MSGRGEEEEEGERVRGGSDVRGNVRDGTVNNRSSRFRTLKVEIKGCVESKAFVDEEGGINKSLDFWHPAPQ